MWMALIGWSRSFWKTRSNKKTAIKCGFVPTTGVEPARPFEHYPLKVACLPIPPRGQVLGLKINKVKS